MATNHTANYQLNLWEAKDKFLREEINENTEKLDAVIKAVDAKADTKANTSALDALTRTVNGKAATSTVTALAEQVNALAAKYGPDNLPWVTGSYTGTGKKAGDALEITLGFQPTLVIVTGEYASVGLAVCSGGRQYSASSYSAAYGVEFGSDGLTLTDNGFRVQEHSDKQGQSMNVQYRKYIYFALR